MSGKELSELDFLFVDFVLHTSKNHTQVTNYNISDNYSLAFEGWGMIARLISHV